MTSQQYIKYADIFFTTEEELKRLYQGDHIFSESHRRYYRIHANDKEYKKLYGDVYEKTPNWDKRLFSVQFNYYEILQWNYRKPQRLLFFNWA